MRRALVLATLLAPQLARADATPLSALPAKPVRYGQAAGPLHVKVEPDPTYYALVGTGGPVCFVEEPPDYWIDGDVPLYGRVPELRVGAREPFGIERLLVRGDTAELERITAEAEHGGLSPLARSRITLHEVARLEGLAVYAYRWQSKVVVLARSAGVPLPPDAEELGMGEPPPECGTVYATLQVRNGSSRVTQIHGTIPGTRKRFLVDASVSQTGRDPEPLLSVTARLLER
jgi:hypothetical protein